MSGIRGPTSETALESLVQSRGRAKKLGMRPVSAHTDSFATARAMSAASQRKSRPRSSQRTTPARPTSAFGRHLPDSALGNSRGGGSRALRAQSAAGFRSDSPVAHGSHTPWSSTYHRGVPVGLDSDVGRARRGIPQSMVEYDSLQDIEAAPSVDPHPEGSLGRRGCNWTHGSQSRWGGELAS